MSTGRLEAFSDGVFAVAITLLVLDLKVAGPGTRSSSLAHQLVHAWPAYATYVVSFMVIGIIWVNHHTLFVSVVHIDRTLLFLNLLLLMFVTVIPFPTVLFADYLRSGGWDAKVAAAAYGGVMEAMGLSFSAVFWWIGTHPELLGDPRTPAIQRRAMRQFGLGSVVYLGTIGLSFISAPVALAAHFAIAVFYVVDRTAATARGDGLGAVEGPEAGPRDDQ